MSRGPRIDLHEFIVMQAMRSLNKEPETWVWQNLSVGDVKIVGWKPGMFKKVSPGVEQGVADIVGMGPGGVHLEFEAKSGTSTTPQSALSTEQRAHQRKVRERGGCYIPFGSSEEAVGLYRKWLTERR